MMGQTDRQTEGQTGGRTDGQMNEINSYTNVRSKLTVGLFNPPHETRNKKLRKKLETIVLLCCAQ